jgi:hypothetical protein
VKLAELYTTYVISGWEGKFKGEVLGEYKAEEAGKVLGELGNLPLLFDIVEVVKALVEKKNKIDEEEIKN